MSVYLRDPDVTLYHGDALEILRGLPAESVHCCVTSPPFYGLRDYGVGGQIGLEETPELWVQSLVEVFREVKRVLRADGTLWLEVGDSYNAYNGNRGETGSTLEGRRQHLVGRPRLATGAGLSAGGLKPKDLIGAPWLLAFALRADGWYLRSDIVWARPNPMPESVTDRPTKAHSYVFLLTKSPRYFFDQEAVRESASENTHARYAMARETPKGSAKTEAGEGHAGWDSATNGHVSARNIRSVWTIPTQPYPEAHFATFPEELARRCIAAGSREGDTVFDPFVGSGTVPYVARKLGRHAIGIDLSAEYLKLAAKRLQQQSLFAEMPA